MSKEQCYHCGLVIPEGMQLTVTIQGKTQPMCCYGCQAVAQAIVESGLEDFYQYRTENSPTGQALIPEFLEKTTLYDNPAIQKRFVRYESQTIREVSLILEGITCAACIWLNERHLRTLSGILDVQVNYATHRARVRWDDSLIHLSDILQAISQIGYLAHPYDPARQQEVLEKERRQQLRQIGLAGVLGMQIMMFSVALYAGDWYGMETEFKILFYWINLVLTLPILLYSARSFFKNAWRDLRYGHTNMDVPVSLGISLAFIGSVWTTIVSTQANYLLANTVGHVYFDSIAMFVFFLLTGRYFELVARQKSARASETLVHLVPTMATRLHATEQGQWEELVLVSELAVGDLILVRPGDNISADGIIVEGESQIDESLLTGESHPIAKKTGQTVIAGTINIDSPLQIQVDKIGADTVISHILRLLERAQTEKPLLTQLADRIAGHFVLAVLFLAVLVALYWWQTDPHSWLAITLSVLVVTCPCALSLATPTAITAATSALTHFGLLITRGHALETLAQATHFIFDKTGTLTQGRLTLLSVEKFTTMDAATCLQYVVALEQYSEHPIAQALITAAEKSSFPLKAESVINRPGAGLRGKIADNYYFAGTPNFIFENTGLQLEPERLQALQHQGRTLVVLAETDLDGHNSRLLAVFVLDDNLRPGAETLIKTLQSQGKQVSLLSGDHEASVRRIAQAVGIEELGFNLTPEDKLQRVKTLQSQGAIVAMMGDGVNDAPVLAQAQVSIAMGGGTQVARASADMILLTEQLPNLLIGISIAQKTLTIIRQNMIWAIGYNVIALPAAAMGLVAPWIAAIGMSLSSLIVVLNALRLVNR